MITSASVEHLVGRERRLLTYETAISEMYEDDDRIRSYGDLCDIYVVRACGLLRFDS